MGDNIRAVNYDEVEKLNRFVDDFINLTKSSVLKDGWQTLDPDLKDILNPNQISKVKDSVNYAIEKGIRYNLSELLKNLEVAEKWADTEPKSLPLEKIGNSFDDTRKKLEITDKLFKKKRLEKLYQEEKEKLNSSSLRMKELNRQFEEKKEAVEALLQLGNSSLEACDRNEKKIMDLLCESDLDSD